MLKTPIFFVVTGGRTYGDYAHVKRILDDDYRAYPGMVIVQGECPTKSQGADGLAKRWCRETGVPCIGIEAPWKTRGRAAGPIRNGWMFDLLPIYKVVAFPGGDGTANCIEQAEKRSVLVRDERVPDQTLQAA